MWQDGRHLGAAGLRGPLDRTCCPLNPNHFLTYPGVIIP
jgi:hypothetical protein